MYHNNSIDEGQSMTTTLQHLTDSTPRLAIIAAFGQEADLLIESTKDKKNISLMVESLSPVH